jgi:hypothetical protein
MAQSRGFAVAPLKAYSETNRETEAGPSKPYRSPRSRRRTSRWEKELTAKPSRCRSLLWGAAHLRMASEPKRCHPVYERRDAGRQRGVRSLRTRTPPAIVTLRRCINVKTSSHHWRNALIRSFAS